MKKRVLRIASVTAALVLACSLLAGCAGYRLRGLLRFDEGEEIPSPSAGTIGALVSKYAKDAPYDVRDPIKNVARNHNFTFAIGFDLPYYDGANYSNIVRVFADDALTVPVDAGYSVEPLDSGGVLLKMGPGEHPAFGLCPLDWGLTFFGGAPIAGDEIFSERHLGEHSEYLDGYLDYRGYGQDWGYLPVYYLVQYVSFQTGEELEKPIVREFTVQEELETPKAEFFVTEGGLAGFRWDPVPGADRYLILSNRYDPDFRGCINTTAICDITYDTTWTHPVDDDPDSWIANEMFTAAEWDPLQHSVYDEEVVQYYGVMAITDDLRSPVCLFSEKDQIAATVPYEISLYVYERDMRIFSPKTVEETSATIPVTMSNGSIVQRIVHFDIENVTTGEFGLIEVPFEVRGTPFRGVFSPSPIGYNEAYWLESLPYLAEREEELTNSAGETEPAPPEPEPEEDEEGEGKDPDWDEEEEQDDPENDTPVPESKDPVFATTAMSEYMALCMLASEEEIDLSAFQESKMTSKVIDAYFEVLYQNPMVLSVKQAKINGSTLIVEYYETRAVREQKQEEIRQLAQQFLSGYISSGMSDLEKVFAINNYLCDTAEYDYDALENAEANEAKGLPVDDEFIDAWTPYGILIDKTGVCESYADAFNVLARAAGLESILIDGFPDGDRNAYHAWNRVCVDGQWITVDVTWNDSLIKNPFLGLPDEIADSCRVEYTEHLIDDSLGTFRASETQYEYYRATGNYYSLDAIAGKLSSGLQSDGYAMLRTEYDLTDEQALEVISQVSDTVKRSFQYTYYFGIIYVRNK